MSFDPFETRLTFLNLVRKLNASQASIQKVVAYALRYGSRCGEDLWECVMEQCAKGSLNTRINILYFLDSLCEACLSLSPADAPYNAFVARDLGEIVDRVVPQGEGVLNLKSARQILESWRVRRIVDLAVVDEALNRLDERKRESGSPRKRNHEEIFSRNDIMRRMEEDRERHKRLRERIWILPIPPVQPPSTRQLHPAGNPSNPSPSSSSPFTPASPSSARPRVSGSAPGGGRMLPPPPPATVTADPAEDKRAIVTADTALELEFEQMWEAGSELDEDDFARMKEDALLAASTDEGITSCR